MKTKHSEDKDRNRDPISGAPGAHPVGTGLGAAAGGAVAGAAAGSVVGPVGTVGGIVAGGIVGGLVGKGVAEKVNPTQEDEYWSSNHSSQPYADSGSYDRYRGAYRAGYLGYGSYGEGRFEDREDDIRRSYEAEQSDSDLTWDDARPAARAAWERLNGRNYNSNPERLIDYAVQDERSEAVGKVHNVWTDESGEPAYLGVKTGWLFGKNHVVPVHTAKVNDIRRVIQLPFSEDLIKDAPSFDPDAELNASDIQTIAQYYGFGATQRSSSPDTRESSKPTMTGDIGEARVVALHEESLKIGKREVEAGSVRIRKVVRTETVNQPVELRREEIVVERIPADQIASGADAPIGEEDIYIPLRREEVVIEKEAHVREGVRIGRRSETEQKTVTEQVRKEDIEVEREQTPRR